MSSTARLLIPFAAPPSDAARAALAALPLANLRAALARCGPAQRDAGEPWTFSAPHERALARARGWSGEDGRLPFAAEAAAADGVLGAAAAGAAWGQVTPSHWHVGTDQVSLLPPSQLALSEAESLALFAAVRSLFVDEGFGFAWGAPLRWYVVHDSLAQLRTASLDRVAGRNVDPWLGSDAAARRVRRLQSEVQMLLHTHPVNAAREERGLAPVNSFWLSGCGVAQPSGGRPIVLDERLREPALDGDAQAWTQAWRALDAGPLAAWVEAAAGDPDALLVLAGERVAATLRPQPRGPWAALRARFARSAPHALLESL